MENSQLERCYREIAAIEAELLAGNPDVEGLLLGFGDWHAELRILKDEKRRQDETGRRVGDKTGDGQSLIE